MAARRGLGSDQATYIISVAAELAGVHPQTLRVYERKGLITPHRTAGNTRRYSARDIDRLRRIQELTDDGVNLAGVVRIMEMEADLTRLKDRLAATRRALDLARAEIETLASRREVGLVPLRDIRRVRRVLKAELLDEAARRRIFAAGPVAGPAQAPPGGDDPGRQAPPAPR